MPFVHADTPVRAVEVVGKHLKKYNSESILLAARFFFLSMSLGVGAPAFTQDSQDIDVSIVKDEAALITGLQDLVISRDSDFTTTTRLRTPFTYLCAHSTTGRYSLSVSSANGYSPFRVESTSGNLLQYQVIMGTLNGDDAPSRSLRRRIFNTPLNLTDRLASSAASCIGQGFQRDANIEIRLVVSRIGFNAAQPGIYSDTLILTIAPE